MNSHQFMYWHNVVYTAQTIGLGFMFIHYCITKWRPIGSLYFKVLRNTITLWSLLGFVKIEIAGAVPQNSCLFVLVSC